MRKISLFFLVCFLLGAAVARAELLPIKTYLSSDGLSYDKLYSIYQDSRGFIWFTSPNGISRFDGYKFVNYGLEDGLEDAMILDVVEDANGVYWFATGSSGVYRFDPRAAGEPGRQIKNSFELVRVSDEPGGNGVRSFCKTRKGEIYVGTVKGLFLLDPNENKFTPIELDLPVPPNKLPSVVTLAEDSEGSLWIGHLYGLSRRLPDGSTIHYEVYPQADGADSVRYVSVDAQNRVWMICGFGKKVVVFNPEPVGSIDSSDKSKRKLRFNPENRPLAAPPQGFAYLFTPADGVEGDNLTSVKAAGDGRIWICSYGKGLYSFDGREVRLYTRENGLSDNTVRNVTADNFGNLWIASDWGAMKLIRNSFATYRTEDGLAAERIDSILQDRNDVLYIVTPGWNINRFDGRRFTAVKLNLPAPANFLSDRVLADHAGEWWFATGNGLYRYAAVERVEKLAGAAPAAVYTTANDLPSNKIRVLFEDSRRDVWFSYDDRPGKLTRWVRATGEFQNFGPEEGIPENCIAQVFREDAAGNLYAPCFSENILIIRNGRISTFAHESFLKNYWISDVLVDRKGRLWVATPTRGLLRVENLISGQPETRLYTHLDGLSGISGQILSEDLSGNIYYLNATGLDMLEPETGKVKSYTIAEVLAGLGNGTAFRDRGGDLWFGGHRGVSRLTPQIETPLPAPPVYIGALRAAGKDVGVSALGETLISGLTLDSDERQMQIDFFGLALATGERLLYQYRLEGADENWSAPTEQRTVNYPNLPAGNYRFLVRAVDSAGVTSADPAVVSFTVLRPVWQRWWFLLLAAFFVSLVVYALYRYRLRRLLELERVRTRIATDLHDDIGSSLSQIAILSEVVRRKVGDNGANEPLNLIADTSREMVDSMSDIVWAINPQKDHFSDLVQRMRRFAEDILDAQDMTYRFHLSEKSADVALGADIRREVYLMFKECLNNLVKYSGATEVELSVLVENNSLVVVVRDNGRGFDVEEKSNGNYDGFGGNGLVNLRRRSINLGGTFEIVSGKNAGTGVTIRIPVAGKINRASGRRFL